MPFEASLSDRVRALAALLQTEAPAARAVVAACEALLPDVRAQTEELRTQAMGRGPELAAALKSKIEPREQALPPAEALLLYGSVTEADCLAYWRGQLNQQGRAIQGILDGDSQTTGEWLYWEDFADERKDGRAFCEAEQIRDCIKECAKLGLLLSGPRAPTRLSRGTTLFADGFARLSPEWKTFGGGEVSCAGGRLRVSGAGNTLWCQREFGDALIAFDYQPQAAAGPGAGALFAFPGTPIPPNDYSISAGPMPRYNRGIDTYHVSLYRGNSGRTNLRRTGPGLKMLSSVQPDACAELQRAYRVEILKYGTMIQVCVDGRLVHAYVDMGVYAPPLARGRFGLRHFSAHNLECFYSRFEVANLQAGGAPGNG